MTSPNFLVGDQFTNQPLTTTALGFMQQDDTFVALKVVPYLEVNKPAGLFWQWNMGDINRDEIEVRADNAPPKRGAFGKSTNQFNLLGRSLAYDVNDLVQKAADVAVNPGIAVPKVLAHKALIKLERMLAAAMTPENWYRTVTGGASDAVTEGTTSTRKYWNDASTDPLTAILEEIQFQGRYTGSEATGAIFGRRLWAALRTHPAIRATLTSGGEPVVRNRMASTTEIAGLLELDYVAVSRAIYNTSLEGEAPTNAYIIPEDSALIFFRQPGAATDAGAGIYNADAPTALARLVWRDAVGNTEGSRIRTYRKEDAGIGGSDRHVLEMVTDIKVISPEMGTLFTGMLGA